MLHCNIISTEKPLFSSLPNHESGSLILSNLDLLAALVTKFGRLRHCAANWEWLALNLSSSIHYSDNWQTALRIIQIHADPLNLNKVERQSGSAATEQLPSSFHLWGLSPKNKNKLLDWHNTHSPNCYWLFCPPIFNNLPSLNSHSICVCPPLALPHCKTKFQLVDYQLWNTVVPQISFFFFFFINDSFKPVEHAHA